MLESVNLGQVLEGLIYAGSVLGAVSIVSRSYKKTLDKIVSPIVEEKVKQFEDKKYQSLQEELTNLSSIIIEYQNSSTNIIDALADNALSTTRNKLLELCNKFIELGEIDDHSLDVIEKLYNSYERLGGNSFMADKMKKVRRLRTKIDHI